MSYLTKGHLWPREARTKAVQNLRVGWQPREGKPQPPHLALCWPLGSQCFKGLAIPISQKGKLEVAVAAV